MMMFADKIDVERVSELPSHGVADYCDFLDAETLLKAIDEKGRKFDRKSLCKYLGIGESTLSGWLKADRIPTSAKNAFVLLYVVEKLQLANRRLRSQLHTGGLPEDGAELKILKNGDSYQVCAFKVDERGLNVGEVVADGIANVETAWLFAGSKKTLELLGDTEHGIDQLLWQKDDYYDAGAATFVHEMEEVEKGILHRNSMIEDLNLWKQVFGESKHVQATGPDEDDAQPNQSGLDAEPSKLSIDKSEDGS